VKLRTAALSILLVLTAMRTCGGNSATPETALGHYEVAIEIVESIGGKVSEEKLRHSYFAGYVLRALGGESFCFLKTTRHLIR